MDVVRSFVSVHGLEVAGVADDVVLVGNAVATVHVTALPRDLQGLAAVVALDDGDHLRGGLALVLEAPDLKASMKTQSDLRELVCHLDLHELLACKGYAELLAVEGVVHGAMEAVFGRAKHTPPDTVPRVVEAREGPFESPDIELVALGHANVREEYLTGRSRAQRKLAFVRSRLEARHATLQNKAGYLAVQLRPIDEDVSDVGVGDPSLGAVQNVRVAVLHSLAFHAGGVGTMIRLGQTE
mmetsp:Transcript_35208/g.76184  ORF Transcript_35208/g.76184 Transcript_35208/m.76184 type:complete len:241 (-) Transcript_35208:211-933(-)